MAEPITGHLLTAEPITGLLLTAEPIAGLAPRGRADRSTAVQRADGPAGAVSCPPRVHIQVSGTASPFSAADRAGVRVHTLSPVCVVHELAS